MSFQRGSTSFRSGSSGSGSLGLGGSSGSGSLRLRSSSSLRFEKDYFGSSSGSSDLGAGCGSNILGLLCSGSFGFCISDGLRFGSSSSFGSSSNRGGLRFGSGIFKCLKCGSACVSSGGGFELGSSFGGGLSFGGGSSLSFQRSSTSF